jgi:hypothetical protein
MHMHRNTTRPAALAGAFFLLTSAALAGPPLVCHALEIGDAKSLPWRQSKDWDARRADYDLSKLTQDTLNLLAPATPVIVRMETLRRAAIYAARDAQLAGELREKLMARARAAEASAKPDALALFDAGYLVETFKQLAWIDRRDHSAGVDGRRMILNAIDAGGDPAMEFAAGLLQRWPNEHSRKARAAAQPGSLLAVNIEKFR